MLQPCLFCGSHCTCGACSDQPLIQGELFGISEQFEPQPIGKPQPIFSEPGSEKRIKQLRDRANLTHPMWILGDTDLGQEKLLSNLGDFLQLFVKSVYPVHSEENVKWRAQVWDGTNSKHVNLGNYDTQEDAVYAVQQWRYANQ